MPRQTTFVKNTDVKRRWMHIDADGEILGRMAVRIATVLMGKHRPEYTPHVDTGDFVVVTNADKFVVTGRKAQQRVIMRYSGYPGGLKIRTLATEMEKHPERVIETAVRRMLPKTRLGRMMIKKLKVYRGSEHPHTSAVLEAL
jgi:large subunit ribosomal protein L13